MIAATRYCVGVRLKGLCKEISLARGAVSTHMNVRLSHCLTWRAPNNREKLSMKVWIKPVASTVDAGFEVTRYLPSTLDVAAKRACK